MICLLLLAPIAGLAAFGAFIETTVKFGLWTMVKTLLSVIFDPFGDGRWALVLLFSLLGLFTAGWYAPARQYGFAIMALGGVLCSAYVLRTYSDIWHLGSVLLFLPGIVSIGLSAYFAIRPMR